MGSGIGAEPCELASDHEVSDLSLYAVEKPGRSPASLEYCADLFDEATVLGMLEHYRMLLEDAVADPDEHVCALPILTEPEVRTLLVDWNDTATAYPECSVHELIAQQARLTPEASAVTLRERAAHPARKARRAGPTNSPTILWRSRSGQTSSSGSAWSARSRWS